MTIQELKQIQLYRQHLTNRADKITVVKDLCGVQAQFMANALHSLKIRCNDYDDETIGRGLAKNWTIRGTVHVFAKEDLPLFIHCDNGQNYRKNEWHGYRFWNQRDCWALTPERQKYFSEVVLSAVAGQSYTREELKEICRAAGMTPSEEESMFDGWGGGMRELCERGFLNYVVQEKKAFCLSPDFSPIPEADAKLEICRRYLMHMAPATIHDICYYFKCPQKQAKAWLSRLPVKSFDISGTEYFYLGEPLGDYPELPACIFLAGFDQLMLAYEKQKSIYLPAEYLRGIFNLAGIVMPSVLLDGVVCGRWKKTKGKLEVFRFRDLTAAEEKKIKTSAEELWGNDITAINFN